jgi:flagellar motor switch protein FliM
MANEILNQDEIDALIHGVDAGIVPTQSDSSGAMSGEVRTYDLATQTRIVRGRMPTLDLINERFARLFRTSLFNMMRRTPQISVGTVQLSKFSDYLHSLYVPTSLNIVKIHPFRGTGLVVLDPKLVFSAVDNFFGGSGRHTKIEGRDFTVTEARIIQLILKSVFVDLQAAWSNVARLNIEYLSSEMNPQFANIAGPTEMVVISTFRIELDGGGGNLHVTMPSSMLEPVREILDSGAATDRIGQDERWAQALREEIEDAEIELGMVLGRGQLTVEQLINLQAGDIVPFDFNGRATVVVGDVPVFRGNYGTSNGMQALKIDERVLRHKPKVLDALLPRPVHTEPVTE